jgi:hypothetical protein
LTREANEEARARLDSFLDRPPERETGPIESGVWSPEAEMAAFQAAAQAAGDATAT